MSADPYRLSLAPDTSGGARVTVTAPLVHECPHVPETDAGTVTIGWRCTDVTVELHSLSAYLASWQGESISHEELTAQIVRDLEALDNLDDVSAVSRWRTAGMSVVVSVGVDEGVPVAVPRDRVDPADTRADD